MDTPAKLIIPVTIRARGRIRAVVHTGHKYDEFGNVVEFGEVLRETPFANNKITNTGFDKMFTAQGNSLVIVCGSGNTTPAETDTTLAAYLGKSETFADYSCTREVVPDGNGDVWWRVTKRATFGPGSLGGVAVNVAEAGITTGVGAGGTNASTPVSARGLLVDQFGNPTTVSVNNAVEYLDIIWEYTEWVKASVTGTVTLSIDGSAVVHNYEVRPYWFDNTGGSYNYGGWAAPAAGGWINWGPVGNSPYTWSFASNCFTGSLVPISGSSDGRGGLGNGVQADIPIQSSPTYADGSKQRTLTMTWLQTYGNKNITVIRASLGHTQWQVSYNPAIAKVSSKQLDLEFRLSYANK